MDFCSLRHPAGSALGGALCEAEGSEPCFNTWATCQDPDNFERGSKTYRFVEPLADLPLWLEAFPYLRDVSVRGTIINPGRSLGQRAQLDARLRGGKHHDRGIDPYAADRSYDPMLRGTMLGRFWARNRYYEGRPARLLRGDLDRVEADGDLSSCEVRRYILDNVRHDGDEWRITCKDPLKLADGDRSLWPRHTGGELAADIPTLGTGSGVGAISVLPEGIGEEYPASGFLRINDEIMAFTRVGDVFTVTRSPSVSGIWETTPDAHEEGDAVQLCQAYIDRPVWEVARELLIEASGMDPAFIDVAAWEQEFQDYLPTQRVTGMLAKPTRANTLLNELQQQTGHYLFWDERASLVRFKALRFPSTFETVQRLDDSASFIAGSISVSDRPEDRISRIIVAFGQRDPTASLEDEGNYRRYQIDTDEDAGSDNEYGAHRVETIFSRWHPVGSRPNVLAFARRLVVTFARVRRSIDVDLAFKDGGLSVGDLVDLVSRRIEDSTGAPLVLRGRVFSEAPRQNSIRVEIRESVFESRRLFVWAPDELMGLHWDDATEEERELYAFWGDDEGLMPDGTRGFAWG